MNDLAVSVYCITYNHSGVIKKCLDGFLMQKTNFKYEVWIHDDNSSDGTVEILKEYMTKFPELIHVIFEEENQYSRGISILNIMQPYLKGKYVAVCEGDDYWTDQNKLQIQFDFMEKHTEVALCAHSATQVNLETYASCSYPVKKERSRYVSTNDLILFGGGHFPTCSFFIRNNFAIIPNRWGKGICGDFNRILTASLNGSVYFLNKNMAVKTLFYPGSWTDRHKKASTAKKHCVDEIVSIKRFNADTSFAFNKAVLKRIANYYYAINCQFDNHYALFLTHPFFRNQFRYLTFRKRIKIFLYVRFRFLFNFYYKIKGIS